MIMKTLSKSEILAARDLESQVVEVPEWGGAVRVRVMSGLARDEFYARQAEGKLPYSQFCASVLVATLIDDAGNALFEEADIAALRGKSQAAMDRVLAVALKLNGLAANAVEEAAKNSAGDQTAATGSA